MLTASLTLPVYASEIKSFSDVPKSSWAYDSIMEMVEMNMFSGTTTPENGVAKFSPEKPMTKAEFTAVVTRYLYPEWLEENKSYSENRWWWGNYVIAHEKGIIPFSHGNMEKEPATRQEMAYVLVKACEELGENAYETIDDNVIPDYNSIASHFQEYVKKAYVKGLIAGIDDNGTFNPTGTLTREQAAAVLYRLVNPSARIKLDLDVKAVDGITVKEDGTTIVDVNQLAQNKTDITKDNPAFNENGVQIWKEGEKHGIPKEGDIIIKEDGTQVVLKATTFYGILENETHDDITILGYGQKVDHVTGTTINGHTKTESELGGPWKNYGKMYGTLSAFHKDYVTNEVHTEDEWFRILVDRHPNRYGNYDNEIVRTEYSFYFYWEESGERWIAMDECWE